MSAIVETCSESFESLEPSAFSSRRDADLKGAEDSWKESRIIAILFNNGTVTETILKLLTPNDSCELLSTQKICLVAEAPWRILECLLQIGEHRHIFNPHSRSDTKVTRLFVLHALKKLGYNCTNCYAPLDGSENGLFACTSLCTRCATTQFMKEGSPYVEGTIRFYLSGDSSISTKGRAFKTHPYWISTDILEDKVKEMHGSAFALAQQIYEEKLFFKKHAPHKERPRDDKAETLREMQREDKEKRTMEKLGALKRTKPAMDMVTSILSTFSLAAPSSTPPLPPPPPPSISAPSVPPFFASSQRSLPDQSFPNQASQSLSQLNPLHVHSIPSAQPGSETTSRKISCPSPEQEGEYVPEFLKELPPSLVKTYRDVQLRIASGLPLSPLGTQPLRELVKTMHEKNEVKSLTP